jgi:hypothetical protein
METNPTDAALVHEAFDLPGYAVLISGTTERLHGPFDTAEQAADYADQHAGGIEVWQVLHLVPLEQ